MPTRAITHIQNIAPGPPFIIAVAIPTIFPVPIVAASAVQSDWNCEICLSSLSVCFVMCLSLKIAPIVMLHQCEIWLNWNPLFTIVITIPEINKSAIPNVPHTMPLITPLTEVIVSNIVFSSLFIFSRSM